MYLESKVKKMNSFLMFIMGGQIMGITLAPFGIYVKEEYLAIKTVENHEKIHWKQQIEMLIIFFYLWYGIEWLIRKIFISQKNAYTNISFEREAYSNEFNVEYLQKRKHYSWLKYMKNNCSSSSIGRI